MSIAQYLDESFFNGVPVLGFSGVRHGNKGLDTLHGCMTHCRVLVNYTLFKVLHNTKITIPDRPKKRFIHNLLTSGQHLFGQRLKFLEDLTDEKIDLVGCEKETGGLRMRHTGFEQDEENLDGPLVALVGNEFDHVRDYEEQVLFEFFGGRGEELG